MKIKINWKKAWEITRDFVAPLVKPFIAALIGGGVVTGLSGCSGLSQRDHEVATSVWAIGASTTLTLLPDMCTEGVWAFEPVSGNFANPCALTAASDAGTANFGVKYYKPE